MKYLLTQKEYDDLRANQEHQIEMSEKKLLTLCRSIANTMPVKWGWSKDEEAKPWTCHMDNEDEWYCDSCPVQDICPGNKHWSQ